MSILFFILASICNAVIDTLAHHYDTSVFVKLNRQFWDASISWENKYYIEIKDGKKIYIAKTGIVWFTDAWHIFKSLMIVFICASIATVMHFEQWYYSVALFAAYGIIWNVFFNLFYNHFLKSKT